MAGQDQYLMDGTGDTLGFSTSPGDEENQMGNGGHFNSNQQRQTPNGGGNGIAEADSLNETQKLQLAERANEIYRQQLKYMQDHLASLRSLIQDKENIIENLMLRYDLGIITQDASRQNGNLGADEIEQTELRRKAEALAQRTILENFELREMVNELRDENFHLRNEIYELQDKINRQVLQINKLEKSHTTALEEQMAMMQQQQQQMQSHDIGAGTDPMMNGFNGQFEDDMYRDVEDEVPDDGQTMMPNHGRGRSITGQDWLSDEASQDLGRGHRRRESQTMQHPAETEEAQRKRAERANHTRKESVKAPDLFGQNEDSEDEEQYMDEEAYAKRRERQNKTRKESVAAPDIYGTGQGDSEEDDEDAIEEQQSMQTGTKRRGSQVFMDEAALAKRQERAIKQKHRRMSSEAPPPIFHDNYDPEKRARDMAQKDSPEAITKRLTRKAKKIAKSAAAHVKSHRRKESLAEKLLLGPSMLGDDDEEHDSLANVKDPEERKRIREKARKEQRRKSKQFIKSQVGDKGHLSDNDKDETDDKPQRHQRKVRKQMAASSRASKAVDDDIAAANMSSNNKKRPSIGGAPVIAKTLDEDKTKKAHRRDSSSPIYDIGFEDPDVLLHYEQLKVKDLEKELESRNEKFDKLEKELNAIKEKINPLTKEAEEAKERQEVVSRELDEAVDSKRELASKCAMEIMRLTMILNALQQHPKLQSLVQTLLEQSANNTNKKNGMV